MKTVTEITPGDWLTVKARPPLTVQGVSDLLVTIADKLGFSVNQLTIQEKRKE